MRIPFDSKRNTLIVYGWFFGLKIINVSAVNPSDVKVVTGFYA